jgi:predicted Rossmann-fold nucleotide-binding protein
MKEMKWSHPGVTDMVEVKSMHERKELMIRDADAIIALPGGVGTLEELTEVITLKQLGSIFISHCNSEHIRLLFSFR